MDKDDDSIPPLLVVGGILFAGVVAISLGVSAVGKILEEPPSPPPREPEPEPQPCDDCGDPDPPRCDSGHCCSRKSSKCWDCRCDSCGHRCAANGYGSCIDYCESCYDTYSYTD